MSQAVFVGGLMEWLGATLLGSGTRPQRGVLLLDAEDGTAGGVQQLTANCVHRSIGHDTESFRS